MYSNYFSTETKKRNISQIIEKRINVTVFSFSWVLLFNKTFSRVFSRSFTATWYS